MRRTVASLIHSIGSTQRLENQRLALPQAEAINVLAIVRRGNDYCR